MVWRRGWGSREAERSAGCWAAQAERTGGINGLGQAAFSTCRVRSIHGQPRRIADGKSGSIIYQEFMMVAVKRWHGGKEDEYYIGVPDKRFFVWFDGFTPVAESELPKEIDVVLLADQTKKTFASRFRFRGTISSLTQHA